MKKKIAVLVRDRKSEALRMAVGATLANDEITVFLTDSLGERDDDIVTNLEMLSDLNVKIYALDREDEHEQIDEDRMAQMLLEYDIVIPY